MVRTYLIAVSFAFVLLAPAHAGAQSARDPLACGREQLALEEGFSKQVFDEFYASNSDPAVKFLGDEASLSVLLPVIEKCAGDLTEDQEKIGIIVLGIVGDQMLIEGRRRLSDLGFDAQRYDDLFVPAFREMPLDALNLLNLRLPDELREPAFALRDEIVENSGVEKAKITEVLVTYISALVGVEAASKVVADLQSAE
jgi:hypothetical protein